MGDGLAEYRRFIDDLVELTHRGSAIGQRIRGNQPLVPLPEDTDDSRDDQLAGELTSEQRQFVARLLDDERYAAIGDVLAHFTWQGYRLFTKDGIELDFEPFGTENYYDFTCRMAGDPWPDERNPQSEETK